MKQYKDRNWLNKKYSIEELNTYQIAKLCNCSIFTIRYWMEKMNIKTRSRSEAFHLARGNHCNLSQKAREWIDGELLGDGCLRSQSKYSANFSYGSKHLEYINYVSKILNSFGIKQAGNIQECYGKYGKYNTHSYHYDSLFYEELLPIRNRWYPDGHKKIPRDLKLTSLVLRQEMIGDGCLVHKKRCRPYIELCTCGFSIPDVEWLVQQLIKLGFKAIRQAGNNMIGISTSSTKQFLNYIGKCPVQCYQYKWSY